MAFLQSLFKSLFSSRSNEPAEADPYEMLQRLRKSHEWIDVKIPGLDKSYQSMIIEIDTDSRELIIDELFPPEGLDKLTPGDTVEVRGQTKTNTVNFYTKILEWQNQGAGLLFKLELPEEIGRSHSRSAYRVYVGGETELAFTMNMDDEESLGITIINLSADGMKISFDQDVTDILKEHKLYDQCVIGLPNGLDIDCEFEVKNIYRIQRPHQHGLAGGVLKITHPQHRAKLNQYLASVQRQQRRRELRE